MAKPRVTVNCVASRYAGADERIIEFITRSGSGGLIAFRETDTGDLLVQVYRTDKNVIVTHSRDDAEGRAEPADLAPEGAL